VTQETGAIKAQSTAGVHPPASICNAEGTGFLGTPSGLVSGGPQGVVAALLCAVGTPPRPRLALWPARHEREPSYSVNRP